MASVKMFSSRALKPLAPVFLAIAFFAINLRAFSVKCNLTWRVQVKFEINRLHFVQSTSYSLAVLTERKIKQMNTHTCMHTQDNLNDLCKRHKQVGQFDQAKTNTKWPRNHGKLNQPRLVLIRLPWCSKVERKKWLRQATVNIKWDKGIFLCLGKIGRGRQ